MHYPSRKKYSSFFVYLIITLLAVSAFSALYMLPPAVKADGESWLTGWNYRKTHVINPATGAGTNYQVGVTVSYGSYLLQDVISNPTGFWEAVVYAVYDGNLYWGVSFGGAEVGYKQKTDLATMETTTLYTGSFLAEWMGLRLGTKIYSVGQESDGVQMSRSSIHIIDLTNDSVTAVRNLHTGDCNEFYGIDTDGTYLVCGERDPGGTQGSDYPNGGGIWQIPISTITDTGTWVRKWEDPNGYCVWNIAYFNGKWYAYLGSDDSFGRWRVISSTDLINWSTELDYTTQNVGYDASRGGLTKCGNKLVTVEAVASTNTFHMFVFDGSSWTNYDLGISIPTTETEINVPTMWLSDKNKLCITIGKHETKVHDKYFVNLDGTGFETVQTNVPGSPNFHQCEQGEYAKDGNSVFYGVTRYGSGGTGSVYRYTYGGSKNICLTSGKCRTDFGDIRFTDDDGSTLLDYWMESKVDSNYAIFWVEVADNLESSAQTIYVYYGKADATTTSNGTNTFSFFDDFSGDLSKWTVLSGSWSIVSGELRYAGAQGSEGLIRSASYQVGDARVRTRYRLSTIGDFNPLLRLSSASNFYQTFDKSCLRSDSLRRGLKSAIVLNLYLVLTLAFPT